ncbi:MAG TPA: CDP-alcohol phosphatidyltransferase family protein, partial [bacterium]|nr:CDP-alcohol phosphatidyltransferase family protein [bacterium]
MRPEIVFLVTVVGIGLLSMVGYAASRGAAGGPSVHTERRGSFALGTWIREWFYWAIRPVEIPIRAWSVPPEVFNALGILLSLGALAAYAPGRVALGGYLLLASGLADVLDGVAARSRGVVSDYGAFLDSTLDRFAEAFVFVGIAVWFAEPLPVALVMTAFAGSMLVSYTRARGEGLGIQCKVGILQRAERLLLLGLGSILDPTVSSAVGREPGFLLLPIVGFIAAGSMGTAIYRTFWIVARLR